MEALDPLMTVKEAAVYSRMTVGQLAQLRYLGSGPEFLNPTPRTILYRQSTLDAWLDASRRKMARSRS